MSTPLQHLSFDIGNLKAAYAAGSLTPLQLAEEIIARTATDPHNVWIQRLSDEAIRGYA